MFSELTWPAHAWISFAPNNTLTIEAHLLVSVPQCDLCASVVSLAWKLFTTETLSTHRDTEKATI